VKLSVLMILNAIFALLGGLGLVLMLVKLMAPYGVFLDKGGMFIAQILGMVLLGLSVMFFLARNVKDDQDKKALVAGALLLIWVVRY